jgi:hypothetical protein
MLEWAEDELKRYNFDFYGDNMNKAVLEVLKTLVDQGHSGMSASIVIQLVDRLWAWKPLTPLTGEDDEWTDDLDPTGNKWQNKRYSAVFKNKETGEYVIGFRFWAMNPNYPNEEEMNMIYIPSENLLREYSLNDRSKYLIVSSSIQNKVEKIEDIEDKGSIRK